MKTKILLLTVIFAGLFCACTDDKGKDKPDATITIEISGITEAEATVSITPKNATACKYVSILKSETLPTAESVMADGTEISATTKETITLKELKEKTEYVIAVAAKGENGKLTLKTETFTTLEPEVKYIEMAGGFISYDGQAEVSQLYLMNIYMWTVPTGQREGVPYDDIVIFTYHKYDLPSVTGGRKVPIGKFTPYYEKDSTKWSDMMYHVGKHVTDEEGEPNYQGAVCVRYDKDHKVIEYIVANDIEETSIEIIDNENGSYTVRGIIADNTKNIKVPFTFTSDKPIMSW